MALRANLACPSRVPPAGRGKASPCPPMKTRARRSHAPTLDAARIARSAIPTSNKATPRSGVTTPSQLYPSPPVPFVGFSVICTPYSVLFFGIHLSTFARLSFRTPYSVLDSALCPLIAIHFCAFAQELRSDLHFCTFLSAGPRSPLFTSPPAPAPSPVPILAPPRAPSLTA